MSDRPELREERLVVDVERDGSTLRLLSPYVGWWSGAPAEPALVGPGQSLGRLRTLNRRWTLVLPPGAGGRLLELPRQLEVAVDYGQQLCRLDPDATTLPETASPSDAEGVSRHELPEGCHAVTAPTDGVFYQRPGPDAAPFVSTGDTVTAGSPVGLIEVMKTFNQILYGGDSLPDRAEVVEVLASDGQEIAAGQALLVVRGKD